MSPVSAALFGVYKFLFVAFLSGILLASYLLRPKPGVAEL